MRQRLGARARTAQYEVSTAQRGRQEKTVHANPRLVPQCGLAKRHLQRRLQPGGYFPDEHGALNVRVISAKDEPLLRVLNATPRGQKAYVNVVLARLDSGGGGRFLGAER